uniref:HAD family hydrolase n=1 Tax=Alkalibaculum bacchi TaxID=645887 RepID=UPI0026F30510
VDSLEGLAFSMNQVLKDNDFETYPTLKYKEFVGNGIKHLVYRALPEEYKDSESVEKYYKMMNKVYGKHYATGMNLYPGISTILDEITDLGIPLAINTNKNQDVTDFIVDEYLSKWNFIKVIGSHDEYKRKPDPSGALALAEMIGAKLEECIYIGDSEVDIKTAKNAGMKCIVVAWGFRDKDYLLTLNPEIVVDHAEDIINYIEKA